MAVEHTIETDAKVKNPSIGHVLSAAPTTDDIRQFRAAVAGVLKTTGVETLSSPDPHWREHWPALTDLGAAALCVPEEQGGLGLQVAVAAATAMELGAALHGGPYAGLVASGYALAATDQRDTLTTELLSDILSGERICAYGRLAVRSDTARLVDGAPAADALLLEDTSTGDLLLLSDPATWSATGQPHRFDTSRPCTDVRIHVERGLRVPASTTARDLFGLLLAADALGGTERVLERTVAYARDRQAFGRAIGGFQAVQHRLADHAIRVRGMSLLVRDAATAIANGDPGAHRSVVLAEASVSGSASHVLHDLLQLTGAIGFTWEYGLHHFERRIHHDARLIDQRRARHELAELEGWTRAG